VSTQTRALTVIQAGSGTRSRLVRRAKLLSWLSIGWMTVEAVAAIAAALIAGSVALLGFGLDSLIELASAGTILWLYSGNHRDPDASERRAQQIIAGCFVALALYLAFDSIGALVGGRHPATSWLGVAAAAGAIVFMPLLATAKGRSPRSSAPSLPLGTPRSHGCAQSAPPLCSSASSPTARSAGRGLTQSRAWGSPHWPPTRDAKLGSARSALIVPRRLSRDYQGSVL
jgi:hypothetical protein